MAPRFVKATTSPRPCVQSGNRHGMGALVRHPDLAIVRSWLTIPQPASHLFAGALLRRINCQWSNQNVAIGSSTSPLVGWRLNCS